MPSINIDILTQAVKDDFCNNKCSIDNIIITFITVTRANQNMMYALGQTGPMSHYKI